MEVSTQLNRRLSALKERFVLTMPDRIAAIASTLADSVTGGGDVMERLERQFHTLAGTAGTYDLDAVAAIALEGEEACTELKHESRLNNDTFNYLGFLVDQLHGALAADTPAHRSGRGIFTGLDVREWTGVSAA